MKNKKKKTIRVRYKRIKLLPNHVKQDQIKKRKRNEIIFAQ